MRDLNSFYRNEPALYQTDFNPDGWRWIDADDSDNSVLTYMRLRKDGTAPVVMACNFTPIPRRDYRIGVPHEGHWREVLNSNAAVYGGTDEGNFGGRMTEAIRLPRLRQLSAAEPAAAGDGGAQAVIHHGSTEFFLNFFA